MSKKPKKHSGSTKHTAARTYPGYTHVRSVGDIAEYKLKTNGLTVLHKEIPDTGVVTTNITYRVGARDEAAGETGLAHMLEHMVFKPTQNDLKNKIDSGAMQFEREVGCILNANTWKDRTTYFFNYPVTHLDRALAIEADRMQHVIMSDHEFQPERGNVLSEHDMYNGDPEFALAVQMVSTAYHSHPYGHETIGYREDIERYTPEKLDRFYKTYYRPENGTMMVIGDIPRKTALEAVRTHFGVLTNPATPIIRHDRVEPRQEGERRITIERPSTTNILALGVKHEGLPTPAWYETNILFDALTSGPDSLLHSALVDTGWATSVSSVVEPTSEENLAIIYITLAPGQTHAAVETTARSVINALTAKDLTRPVKKAIAKTLTDERFARTSSLGIASELTEFVAAGDWTAFTETEAKLRAITPAKLIARRNQLFTPSHMTIGSFIGNQQ